MDKHVYFKENRVNKFTQEQLAEECGIKRQQIVKSLKYLREHHILVTIGYDEYVNPRYAYQCGPETLKELIANIVNEHHLWVGEDYVKKPSLWPKFNFRKVRPARAGDERRGDMD